MKGGWPSTDRPGPTRSSCPPPHHTHPTHRTHLQGCRHPARVLHQLVLPAHRQLVHRVHKGPAITDAMLLPQRSQRLCRRARLPVAQPPAVVKLAVCTMNVFMVCPVVACIVMVGVVCAVGGSLRCSGLGQ